MPPVPPGPAGEPEPPWTSCAASSAAPSAPVLAGPPPPCAEEVAALATEAMEAHLDRRLRAVRSVAGL